MFDKYQFIEFYDQGIAGNQKTIRIITMPTDLPMAWDAITTQFSPFETVDESHGGSTRTALVHMSTIL